VFRNFRFKPIPFDNLQAGTIASIRDEQTRNQEHNINELRIPNCTDVVGVEPAVKNRMEWTRRACSARENNPK